MQTKHELQQLLATYGAVPNKKLGQNFLIDLNLMRYLLDESGITKDDLVLEVGCGTGSMTEGISERAGRVIVVEYDRLMHAITSSRLAGEKHVTVIHGDALNNKNSVNLEAAKLLSEERVRCNGRFMMVANLPYNIAASLMVNLIVNEPKIDAMYVTIQKEVAQRMSAKPGDDLYGILSIIMEATGKVRFMRKLPHSVFWPAPKVESAMVEFIADRDKILHVGDLGLFREIVGLFMGHRRKMLKACTKFAVERLKGVDWVGAFAEAKIDSTLRAEKLLADDFVRLGHVVAGQLK